MSGKRKDLGCQGIEYRNLLKDRDQESDYRYIVTPKLNPTFNSIVDAHALLYGDDAKEQPSTSSSSTSSHPQKTFSLKMWAETNEQGSRRVFVRSSMELAKGNWWEICTFSVGRGGILLPEALERQAWMGELVLREERALFGQGLMPFPEEMYPDTIFPFLLRLHPPLTQSQSRKSFFTWTGDRFVARVVSEVKRAHSDITVPFGTFNCSEIALYPDLTDYGITRFIAGLAKPFLPVYRLWISNSAPHILVRLEGALGPPGAPEVVFELSDVVAPSVRRRNSVTTPKPVGALSSAHAHTTAQTTMTPPSTTSSAPSTSSRRLSHGKHSGSVSTAPSGTTTTTTSSSDTVDTRGGHQHRKK